jgi:hypothetical protein
MGKVEEYREQLRALDDWDAFLLRESRLPGPRANLELAFAAAREGTEEQILRWASLDPVQAPTNAPLGFLAVCGVLGLGCLAARGKAEHFALMRAKASDPRWRIREAVALGLQEVGRTSLGRLLDMMEEWSQGTLLEKRAVVAALCEPGLLVERDPASRVLDILDEITASVLEVEDRRSEAFRVLRKGLAYGWSVVVAAQPSTGKPRMEAWIGCPDADVRWVMKQNLQKKRLSRMDASWVQAQLEALGQKRSPSGRYNAKGES